MFKILLLVILSTSQKVSLNDGTSFDDKILQANDSAVVFEKSGKVNRQSISDIKVIPQTTAPKIEFSDTTPIQQILKDATFATAKYGSAKGIILLDEDLNILNPDGTQLYRGHFIGRILSPETRDWADLRRSFDETRGGVRVLLARTIHPDGSVSYLDFSKIKISSPAQGMVFFNEYKVLSCNLPDVEIGDIVEYVTESDILKPYDAKQFEPCFFFGGSEPVVDAKSTVIIPDTLELNIYSRNGAPQPKITTSNNKKQYVWEMRDIAPMIDETYMPGAIDIVPGIFCTLFKDWNYWFDKESGWKKERLEITPEIKDLVSKTVRDGKTRADSIALIYHWVQKNVRYISIKGGLASGSTGHPAAVTLKAGYGDCTDKANLLATMLRAIGVNAYPVAVYTNDEGRIPYRQIPILWGNHEIVEVRTEKDTSWLDPVTESYRYPYFSAGDHGILCINSLCRSIDTIPIPPPEDNALNYKLEAKIDTAGDVMVESYRSFTGGFEAGYREFCKYTKDKELKDRFQGWINSESPGAELVSYEVGPVEDLMKPFYLVLKYKMKDYPTRVGDLWVINAPGFRKYEFPEVASTTRKYNIEYSSSSQTVHNIKITIPPGYKVNWVPDELKIKNKYASYEAKYTITENGVEFADNFSKYERVVPVKDYKEYKDFLKQVANYSKEPIIIKKK